MSKYRFYEMNPFPLHTCTEFKLEAEAVYLSRYSSESGQKHCYEFNVDGYLQNEEIFQNGKLVEQKVYSYDTSCRLVSVTETDGERNCVLEMIYSYNECGQLTGIVHRLPDSTVYKQLIIEYDTNGKLIRKTSFHPENNIVHSHLFFNDAELVIRKEYFNQDGQPTQVIACSYNKDNLVEEYSIQNLGYGSTVIHYKYDQNRRQAVNRQQVLDGDGNVLKSHKIMTEYLDQCHCEIRTIFENDVLESKTTFIANNDDDIMAVSECYDKAGNICEKHLQSDYPYSTYLARDESGRVIRELKFNTENQDCTLANYVSSANCFKAQQTASGKPEPDIVFSYMEARYS